MSVGFARPDVSQLVFRLFDRPVHPELFETFAVWSADQPEYGVEVRITNAGHVVAVRTAEGTQTEVALPEDVPLPSSNRRMSRAMRGSRSVDAEFVSTGVRFQGHHQVEHVDPEVYLNLHEEFLVDSGKSQVAHRFSSSNRFAPDPVSLVRIDVQRRHLLVHAFHTFPANCAVVRTQSLFEFPEA